MIAVFECQIYEQLIIQTFKFLTIAHVVDEWTVNLWEDGLLSVSVGEWINRGSERWVGGRMDRFVGQYLNSEARGINNTMSIFHQQHLSKKLNIFLSDSNSLMIVWQALKYGTKEIANYISLVINFVG